MGCVTSTAKRRRKQAKAGYTHIAKSKRPRYSKGAGAGPAGKTAMSKG